MEIDENIIYEIVTEGIDSNCAIIKYTELDKFKIGIRDYFHAIVDYEDEKYLMPITIHRDQYMSIYNREQRNKKIDKLL